MKKHHYTYDGKRQQALQLILDDLPGGRLHPYGDREIARMVGISKTTVGRIRRVATEKHLTWSSVAALSHAEQICLLNRLSYAVKKRHPDWAHLHAEMLRPGMTLQRIWRAYQATNLGDAMSYQRFAKLYRKHTGTWSRFPTAGRTPTVTTRRSL
jgi:hypothetical protein